MVRFYSSIDSDDIVLNSVVTDYLHRTDFDVVPRKLISKMQAFSQRTHVRISARRALSCWEVEVWASTASNLSSFAGKSTSRTALDGTSVSAQLRLTP